MYFIFAGITINVLTSQNMNKQTMMIKKKHQSKQNESYTCVAL